MALDGFRLMAMGARALPDLHAEAQELVVVEAEQVGEFQAHLGRIRGVASRTPDSMVL